MKFNSLLDACCHLIRSGYRWEPDYERFERDSWSIHIHVQKNGKVRVRSY